MLRWLFSGSDRKMRELLAKRLSDAYRVPVGERMVRGALNGERVLVCQVWGYMIYGDPVRQATFISFVDGCFLLEEEVGDTVSVLSGLGSRASARDEECYLIPIS